MRRAAAKTTTSTRDFVRGLLRGLQKAFAAQLAATRADPSRPEAIHQLRVACRRLRTCLAVYGRHLPGSASKLRRRLRRLAGGLSLARDLDVMLQRLRPEADLMQAAVAYLQSRREAQNAAVRETLGRRGVERIAGELQRIVDGGRAWPGSASRPIRTEAPRIVKRAWCEFLDACADADEARSVASWHEVRIHGKRLRYTLEGLRHLLGNEAEPALQVLIELQDELGAYLDSRVALDQLKDLQDFAGLDDAACKAMETVMARLRVEGKAALAAVPGLLQQLRDWGPELAPRKAGKDKQ